MGSRRGGVGGLGSGREAEGSKVAYFLARFQETSKPARLFCVVGEVGSLLRLHSFPIPVASRRPHPEAQLEEEGQRRLGGGAWGDVEVGALLL